MVPDSYEVLLELVRREAADEAFSFRTEPQAYLRRLPDGTYRDAVFPWAPPLLEDLAELEKPRPDRGIVQRLGDRLRAFLEALGWEPEERAIQAALEEGRAVHLTLRFAAAELYALPWELVTLGTSGLCLAELPGCLIRYEWPGTRSVPSEPRQAGRILFAWSAAGGSVPAAAHLRALRRAAEEGVHPFDPEQDVVEHVSLQALEEALARPGERPTVLHLLCHGSRRGDTWGLLWNGAQGGEPELVDGGALRQLLAPHAGSLRLVVLSACQSGTGVPGNHLGSIAHALHRAGIQAVVASRLPLSIPGSVVLAESLYGALLGEPCSLERSLERVRQRLGHDTATLDWASVQLYARAEDGGDTRPVALRPYRGLLAFQKSHRRFFFGRERLQQELLRRLVQARDGSLPRFQVIAGASGSGKSSLVFAGLLPGLLESHWEVRVLRPSERRTGELAALLHSRKESPGRTLLLLVDQFEELFTQVPDVEERQRFVSTLWELARKRELEVVVVVTLRVDYFGRCGELVVDEQGARLDAVVYSDTHRVFVSVLQGDGLRAAIEAPAQRVGLTFEPGLVDVLLRDVGHEPGALPLLQYALDQLWARREDNRLTHRAYEAIGGVGGALTQAAEQLYAGLPPEAQQLARRLMVELVAVQEGALPGTRRRASLERIRPAVGEARAGFDEALERLVSARLLTRGGGSAQEEGGGSDWVQLSHESLIRTWPRLLEWAREDQERLQHLRELQAWAEEWKTHRGEPDGGRSYLLTGSRLGYAERMRELYAGELQEDILQLIAESEARLALERRTTRRRVLALVGAALAAAGVMAGLMTHARQKAREEQRAREEAHALALRARDATSLGVAHAVGRVDPTLALLMLREVRQAGHEGSRTWAQDVAEVLRLPLSEALLRGHQGAVVFAAFSPDGARVATASKDGTARLWRADGKGQPQVLAGHGGELNHVAFDADGKRLLTSSRDGTARVWRSDGTGAAVVLRGHGGAVLWGAFSPDGTRIATASSDGTARVWTPGSATPPLVLEGHAGPVVSVAFSPDGGRVVTASQDGTARVWTLEAKPAVRVLAGHAGPVTSAVFSPEGTRVLTASRDGTARIWPVLGGGRPVVLAGHQAELTTASFSPDGTQVVTASWDHTARLWRADGRGVPRVLGGHLSVVYHAAFNPEGTRVLTVSADTTARLWSARVEEPPQVLRGHRFALVWGTFSQKGGRVVTASVDTTARVWNLERSGLDSTPLPVHGGTIWSVAFDARGTRWAAGSQDGTVLLGSSGAPSPRELRGHTGAVRSVAFSADGRWLLTASQDGTARVWPTDGGGPGRLVVSQREGLFSAAFSPDGTRLVIASSADNTRILSADGSRTLVRLVGHGGQVRSAVFSPDGTRVLTASQDGTARVWRLEEARARVSFIAAHNVPVRWATWSPDGKHFVTAGSDGRMRVWSADGTGEPLVYSGHEGDVTSVAFHPEGQRVLTGSSDQTARLWVLREALSETELRERLRETSTACLTPPERLEHLGDTPEAARRDYEGCERNYGREPLDWP